MEPLTPNTSAFISYLSSAMDQEDRNPTSLPPSAFFPMPVPGRDTPEDTPPSSHERDESPEQRAARVRSVSDDSDEDSQQERIGRRDSEQGVHKRKAGGQSRPPVEDEEDEESDSDVGHEDKRQHGAGKNGKKGGGKSEDGQGKGTRDVGKAARRKEQNRAAQKAFRERREAKVKDLEEKVSELETKSYGATVENENLRGILKRLQEENVALKQSAFSFSMPLAGSSNSSPPARQPTKPPSPPQSDEGLRSINDPPLLPHTRSGESPESLVSLGGNSTSSGSQGAAKIFDANTFDPFSGLGPLPQPNSGLSRSHSDSTNPGSNPDLDALFASFYPNGIDAVLANGQISGRSQPSNFNAPSPFNFANLQPSTQSNSQNADGRVTFNSMAYREPTSAPVGESRPPVASQGAPDVWADINDSSVDDFLASLTGANNDNLESIGADDDLFNAQLQQIFQQSGTGNSPSSAFTLPQNGPSFSPTNYLNTSPSPLNSVSNSNSNSQSPGSIQTSSTSVSPESSGSCAFAGEPVDGGISTFGHVKAPSEHVYVVDEAGKIIQPSEMWIKLGMQHEDYVDHLVIDDLCDQMRAKATCKDGTHYLKMADAEHMFKTLPKDYEPSPRLKKIAGTHGIPASQ